MTTFLFFGTFGFNFLFNMLFTHRYCRMLEENSFRGRTSDFVMMFVFGASLMIIFAFFVNLLFLGNWYKFSENGNVDRPHKSAFKLDLWERIQDDTLNLLYVTHRSSLYNNAGLRVGTAQPLCANEFLWATDVPGAVLTMGLARIFSSPWQLHLRWSSWNGCRTRLLLWVSYDFTNNYHWFHSISNLQSSRMSFPISPTAQG